MAFDTKHALKKRNVSCRSSADIFTMPDPYLQTRNEHMTFLDTLNKAADVVDLFTTLNKYWDHFNYHLLERLIMAPRIEKYICNKECIKLQEAMREYVRDMDVFRRRATLGVYCRVFVKEKEEVPKDFIESVTKHEWSEENTLQDVEDFRQKVAKKYQLLMCLVFFKNILFGSVHVTWWIPIIVPQSLCKSSK